MAAHDPQFGPPGDPSRHLPLGELEQKLGTLPAAPRDAGRVALLVRRRPDKVRETPTRIDLGPDSGVPGDAWGRGQKPDSTAQVTVMEIDVAEIVALEGPDEGFGEAVALRLYAGVVMGTKPSSCA